MYVLYIAARKIICVKVGPRSWRMKIIHNSRVVYEPTPIQSSNRYRHNTDWWRAGCDGRNWRL